MKFLWLERQCAPPIVKASLASLVAELAEQGDWGDVPLSTLRSYFDQPYTGSLHPRSDVIEPVAAALELLSRKVNLRQICAVVDVGAGTTDIGLFYSVVTEGHADRLIPLSTTRSVFKAGNEIDQVLYQILAKKSGTTDQLRLYDIRTRILGTCNESSPISFLICR